MNKGSQPNKARKPLTTTSNKTLKKRRNVNNNLHTTALRFMALDPTTQKFYSQSLALPTPAYPLRPNGGSLSMEAKVREQISTQLYQAQLDPNRPQLPGEHIDVTTYRHKIHSKKKTTKRTRLPYRLHDGPPFANGDLHMGHFLNKTLKDVANRYKLARGYRIEFYPGWDCHGLPIELKATEATMKSLLNDKKNKKANTKDSTSENTNIENATALDSDEVPAVEEIPSEYRSSVTGAVLWGAHTPTKFHPHKKPIELRDIAMKFAQSAILRQKQNMLDWSLLGDFNNPYITMDPTFEAAETLVLGNLIEKNSLYRQLMPVHWSPSSKTALAESELEYKDITSTAAYVCMPLVQHGGIFKHQPNPIIKHNNQFEVNPEGLSLLIWTTTPWTLPANRAICVSPEGKYAHVQTNTTTTLVINKIVYDIIETKNVVMIETQVDTLSATWKRSDGLNIDTYKQFLTIDPETAEIDISTLPPGLKLVKKGEYDVEQHGSKAIVTKGKNKGQILDLVIGRDVSTEIIQSDIDGARMDNCTYISPLSLRLRPYLMKDTEKCVDINLETCEIAAIRNKSANDDEISSEDDISAAAMLSIPIHKVIPASHVLPDQGSGCVHTAPAHGQEDYEVGIEHKVPVACPVDEKGEYTPDVGKELFGVSALEGGSKRVMKMLHENSSLFHREEYDHRYPHDWRTLKPTMLRATSQWFCKLDDAKQVAKNSLDSVYVTTESGRNRLTSFIDSRDKWCISRQRYWGLPIPVFYNKEDGEQVLHTQDTTFHLSSLYSILGTQAWWSLPTWRLLPAAHRGQVNQKYIDAGVSLDDIVNDYLTKHNIEKNNQNSEDVKMSKNKYDYTNSETIDEMDINKNKKIITHIDGEPVIGLPDDYYECTWKIGEDTVDVWLDSGSSWFSALFNKLSQSHLDGGYQQDQDINDADSQHNNLYSTLKHKRQTFNEKQDVESQNGSQFDPYAAVFGDLQSIKRKDHQKLIGEHIPDEDVDQLSWQADLYVEGSDQHRGWFQSSILLSSLLTGHSPFKALQSHGFVVDEQGRKMSKSLGNGVEPNTIISDQGHGVDVLRCWAASIDCSRDAMMGKTSIQTTIDFVRKWRGVMRFQLGCLSYKQRIKPLSSFTEQDSTSKTDNSEETDLSWDFNPISDLVPYQNLHILDKYILHHLQVTLNECEQGYQHYQLHKVINSVKNFMQQPLSSVYFDLSKDRLYANSSSNDDKKAALTTLYYVFSSLLKVMTPVLPHLTQELFSYLPSNIQNAMVKGLSNQKHQDAQIAVNTECVANSGWVEIKDEWSNADAVQQFDSIMNIRSYVNQCLEICRQKALPTSGNKDAANKEQTKKNKKGGKDTQLQQQPVEDLSATEQAPATQIVGDVNIVPKIGSSNEAEVSITIRLPIRYQDLENADVATQSNYKNLINILTQSNNDKLHELFMVSGTSVHIDYICDTSSTQHESSDAVDNTQYYHIKEQENTHNSAEKRVIVETSTPLSKDAPDIILTIGVSKSNGHKCPRCWRYSSAQDTIATINQSFSSPQNISKLFSSVGASNTLANAIIYKSFIPSTINTAEAFAAEDVHSQADDILCKRCDDFFSEALGTSI